MDELGKYTPEGAEEFVAPTTGEAVQDLSTATEATSIHLADKIAEYLTGMRVEDENIGEKLAADREIIRGKYHLPSRELPPRDYESSLKQTLAKLGVDLRPLSDCGKLLEENPMLGAAYLHEAKTVGVNAQQDGADYFKYLGQLEHETIHAIQHKETPSMPVELMEYEAYLAGSNIDILTSSPEAREVFFSFLVGGSVEIYYQRQSETSGSRVAPSWEVIGNE